MDRARTWTKGLIWVLIAPIWVCSCERTSDGGQNSRNIVIPTRSGEVLSGILYPARVPNAPGILLVHDAGSSATVWGGFPERLRAQGYTCLAVDLVGHGASLRNDADFRAFDDSDWKSRASDVSAACEALVREGCESGAIGAVGEGFGGSLVFDAAARGAVASAVLVSTELESRGIALMAILEKTERVPTLVIASEGDSAGVTAGERLESAASGFFEYRMYPGNSFGADLIANSESAAVQIVQWFEQTLPSPALSDRD